MSNTSVTGGRRVRKDVAPEIGNGRVVRIPVMDVSPVIGNGRFPAKAAVGEPFEVSALVFREGHDRYGADVVLTDPRGRRRPPLRMRPRPDEPARHTAIVSADAVGPWTFEVQSWSDPLATWLHATSVKVPAGVDVELMFTEGVLLLERWEKEVKADAATRAAVRKVRKLMADGSVAPDIRLHAAESAEVRRAIDEFPLRDLCGSDEPHPFFVDRERALATSWYEFFPRSEGAYRAEDGSMVSGTFRTAAKRLPAVAAMGFDVLYLPPIHPIGEVNRKGPNNVVLEPAGQPHPEDWVGSPWAIGSRHGGHDAVHPDLGTLEDFDAFVAEATALGLEVALDFALQAAPDHPWVEAHPEWFTMRADGSIAYAENPPKKYQDIYPINFDNDYAGILAESERVLRHWMERGIRVFRVDNPHTKPVHFWADLFARIRATDPDVVFLSEAFTAPPMMRALATVGFHQSYTYFTWRNTRAELEAYLTEVSHDTSAALRPSFWVNTPDINPFFLQSGTPAAFKVRAVLAATGSPSWGVYAGYELCEHQPLRPGAEEYLDSEKFQLRPRDWEAAEAAGQSLAPYLTRLNQIRREHAALRQLRNVTIHSSDDDAVLCFSKHDLADPDGGDAVIVVANLDPHHPRETLVHLDLAALGLPGDALFEVTDLLTGQTWTWSSTNYVRLDPGVEPAHVLHVRRTTGGAP